MTKNHIYCPRCGSLMIKKKPFNYFCNKCDFTLKIEGVTHCENPYIPLSKRIYYNVEENGMYRQYNKQEFYNRFKKINKEI